MVVWREPAVGRLIKPHPSGKETSASPELRIPAVDASGFKVPFPELPVAATRLPAGQRRVRV